VGVKELREQEMIKASGMIFRHFTVAKLGTEE
jgi:hypothetical protein